MCQLPVNGFHKRIGPEPAWPFPRLKTLMSIHDEVAAPNQFIPFQTPKALRIAGWRGRLDFETVSHE